MEQLIELLRSQQQRLTNERSRVYEAHYLLSQLGGRRRVLDKRMAEVKLAVYTGDEYKNDKQRDAAYHLLITELDDYWPLNEQEEQARYNLDCALVLTRIEQEVVETSRVILSALTTGEAAHD